MQRLPLVVVAARTAAGLPAACDDGKTSTATPTTPASSAAQAAPAVDLAAWSKGTSTPAADKLYPQHGNAGLDVLHYDLRLTWQPQQKNLKGTATLRIRPTADASEIKLDVKPYALDEVTVDGTAAKATVVEEKLVVPVAVSAG